VALVSFSIARLCKLRPLAQAVGVPQLFVCLTDDSWHFKRCFTGARRVQWGKEIFGPAQATNLAGHRSDEFGQAVKKVKKKKAKGVLR
jgi:hypothetical protein